MGPDTRESRLRSCLYEGWVRHRRLQPFEHAFRYRLFLVYLDLDELDRVFRGSRTWSTNGPALAWFRRADHLGDPERPLDESVRDLVEERTGRRPHGPIRLLTHLRYFGYVMNPISLFYCFDPTGEHVESIVAEVNNTPWNERHCYVLDAPFAAGTSGRAANEKEFHVSPFMPMDLRYDWTLTAPGRTLGVRIATSREGQPVFDASMGLRRRPLTRSERLRTLLRYPLMTARVFAAIYWQALRLWWRGAAYHPHPRTFEPTDSAARADVSAPGVDAVGTIRA